jgi:hypothetical protein
MKCTEMFLMHIFNFDNMDLVYHTIRYGVGCRMRMQG